jgi:integrase
MSVYKPKGSPFYHFDFQRGGHRFHGSTGCTNRRDAEQIEEQERERAKQAGKVSTDSLQLDAAAGRYWVEVGQHHAGAKDTWRDIARLVDHLGGTCRLSDITDSEVARLVAWRRGQTHRGRHVSPATVNRSTTEVLKKLFTRAKTAWGARFDHEPNWKAHMLSEPQERVRELQDDEAAALDLSARADYAPFFAFAKATGLRLNECLLKWSEVNWKAGRIQKLGKGKKLVTAPLTATVRAILLPLQGHHTEMVFTYVAKRTKNGRQKGLRYPLTYQGVKTQWRRLRTRAGVSDLRFHDLRHDLATKLLRETGNLKLVQRALNHSDIKTTVRYAHVLDSEVAAALERVTTKPKRKVV